MAVSSSTVPVDSARDLSAEHVAATLSKMEEAIKPRYPEVRRLFIEAQNRRAYQTDILAGRVPVSARDEEVAPTAPTLSPSAEDA